MRLGFVVVSALAGASTIVACSGFSLPPDLVTIHGTLAVDGLPVAGAPFWPTDRAQPVIGAQMGGPLPKSSPRQTDSAGRFFIYGFGPTYDVTFAQPNDPTRVPASSKRAGTSAM